jgi:thymidine phosphorylase
VARKLGEAVRAGEPLYRIHAASPSELQFAREAAQNDSAFAIGRADQVAKVNLEV